MRRNGDRRFRFLVHVLPTLTVQTVAFGSLLLVSGAVGVALTAHDVVEAVGLRLVADWFLVAVGLSAVGFGGSLLAVALDGAVRRRGWTVRGAVLALAAGGATALLLTVGDHRAAFWGALALIGLAIHWSLLLAGSATLATVRWARQPVPPVLPVPPRQALPQ